MMNIAPELKFILDAIQQTPSADNSQPWRLICKKNTLTVCYDQKRCAQKTFSVDNPATLLSFGALLENIYQSAQALGLEFELKIPEPFDLDNPVYFDVTFFIKENPIISDKKCIPLFNRHTNRHPYLDKVLPKAHVEILRKMTINEARIVIIEDRSEIKNIAELVRLASEIRFQTQEVHEWLGRSLRFGIKSEEHNDGLDVNTLDLPPGGKIFLRLINNWQRMKLLNIMGAYKVLSAIDSKCIKQAPALVAIISPNGFKNILSTGQLMNRVWIKLNDQGIAVQPYYVVSDQLHRRESGLIPKGLEKQATFVFNKANSIFHFNQNESLQMLLRIGYPTKKPILSKRLPIEAVFSELAE